MLILTFCKRKKTDTFVYTVTKFYIHKMSTINLKVTNCILYLVIERQSTIFITQYIDYYTYNAYVVS